MKLYKLTDQNGQTYNKTQWGPNVTHKATGELGQDLCSNGWIHAYEHPLLAAVLNPIHAAFSNPILWEAEGEIGKRDGQLKCGCHSLTTIQQTPLPKLTTTQLVAFAILCAKQVYKEESWNTWANNWLNNKDRSARAASEAASAAAAAAWSAAAAAYEAWAASAARAWSTSAARAAAAAWSASAAWAAARAASEAIDLIKILEQVIKEY